MCEFLMNVINCSGYLECKIVLKYYSWYIIFIIFYRMIIEIDLKGIFIKVLYVIILYKWNILYWFINFGDDFFFFIWNYCWEYFFYN